MTCDVGCRCSSDLALRWLWCRLAALIGPWAWEPEYAMGVAQKRQKKKKPQKTQQPIIQFTKEVCFGMFDVMILPCIKNFIKGARPSLFKPWLHHNCFIREQMFPSISTGFWLKEITKYLSHLRTVMFFFFFWLCPGHAEVPGPGTEPVPQQWQRWILNQ